MRSACPISYSLDVFGDRWTLLVLRDLVLRNKRRYREFLASDEGIASNILSDRLRRLEDAGIVTREADPVDGRQIIYAVTDKGRSVVPVLLELLAWGASQNDADGSSGRFAESFYANRESFYESPGEKIAALIGVEADSEQ
jgi:DNA-binding HxlR family transcriptional regulator